MELQELDISGCRAIDANLFVDCIAACTNLRKLEMKACSQFTQYHMIKLVVNLKQLRFLEFSNTQDVSVCNAHAILANMQKLEKVNFDPKTSPHELQGFKQLMAIFRNIHFGNNITRHFPFNARYVCRTSISDEL